MWFFSFEWQLIGWLALSLVSVVVLLYWYVRIPGGTRVIVRYPGGSEVEYRATEADKQVTFRVGKERRILSVESSPGVREKWGKARRYFYNLDGEDFTTFVLDPDGYWPSVGKMNRFRKQVVDSMVIKDLASGLLTRVREVLMGVVMGAGVMGMIVLLFWMNTAGLIG